MMPDEIAKKPESTERPVGYVLGNKPSSTMEYYVLVDEGNYLELDDIVYGTTHVDGYPGQNEVTFYGTVTEIQQYHEGIQFDSDTIIVKNGILPAASAYIGKVLVTKIDPEIFVSLKPADQIFRATGERLNIALSFDAMKERFPVGLMRNKEPFFANFEFVNGSKGAHISISGVSGVATKTSYATFLLHSIFNYNGPYCVPSNDKGGAKALIFNVKGEDLLFLDKRNKNLTDEQRAVYAKMGLPAEPFKNVGFYASPKAIPGAVPTPGTEQRQEGITPYIWTMRQFSRDRLLPFLFSEGDQETTNMYGVLQHLTNKLEWLASSQNIENDPKASSICFNGQEIKDLRDLIEILEAAGNATEESEDGKKTKKNIAATGWFTSYDNPGTVFALLRRMRVAAEAMEGIIRSDVDHPENYSVDFYKNSVTVIDISKLKPVGQKFIVGSTLKALMNKKEMGGRKPYVFVVLDELNKYAPREGRSPIADIMLDIAERGRSLGIILIGAQQSASQVEKRIISNSSIRVNGRLDFAESQSPEYDYLPGSFRVRSCIIKPGTMLMLQPDIPAPTILNFPMPAWATRGEEVEDQKELDQAAQEFADKFK